MERLNGNIGIGPADPALEQGPKVFIFKRQATGQATGQTTRRRLGSDMATRQINVERFTVTSSKAFESVVASIEAAIGHPDMREFAKHSGEAASFAELKHFIEASLGESGFMEFARF